MYGDNVAGQRLFEHVGFTREGTRRSAYWHRGQWIEGVLYGLLADELPEAFGEAQRPDTPPDD